MITRAIVCGILVLLVMVAPFVAGDVLSFANLTPDAHSKISYLLELDPLAVISLAFEEQSERKGLIETKNDYNEIAHMFEDKSPVNAIIWLSDNRFTSPEYHGDMDKKRREIRKLQDAVLSRLSEEDFRLQHRYIATNGFAGSLSRSGFERLRNDLNVISIVPDRKVYATLQESRPLVRGDVVETNLGVTGSGVAVCVADTGIDYGHPALAQRYVGGYDFVNNDPDPMDDSGHGTNVAGIIASTDARYRGVAPGASIAAVKVLAADMSGTFAGVAAGIDWCVNNQRAHNIKAVTMSFGDLGQYSNSNCPSTIDPAIRNAASAGMFIDAATGNGAYIGGISYPACAPSIAAVGATYDANVGGQYWTVCNDLTTQPDQIACFTNRASNLDFLAPGSIVTSTSSRLGGVCVAPSSNFGSCSGTSQAAPHVAGVAALLYQINPYLSPYQIEQALKTTGVQITDPITTLTFPRVDALGAANFVQGITPFVTVQGEARIGNEVRITVHDSLSRNMPYIIAVSLGNFPGISLPDGRTIPLNMDALFIASTIYPSWIDLRNSQGQLNANGDAEAVLRIPRDAQLVGTRAYVGFITLDIYTRRIASVSPAVPLQIRP